MSVALDEPLGVVSGDEAGHGLAEVVDVVVQPGPEALLLEGLDPVLGATVALGLADMGGVVGDAQSAQRAEEVGRAVLRTPVVAQPEASPDVGPQLAPAVEYGVVDRL